MKIFEFFFCKISLSLMKGFCWWMFLGWIDFIYLIVFSIVQCQTQWNMPNLFKVNIVLSCFNTYIKIIKIKKKNIIVFNRKIKLFIISFFLKTLLNYFNKTWKYLTEYFSKFVILFFIPLWTILFWKTFLQVILGVK